MFVKIYLNKPQSFQLILLTSPSRCQRLLAEDVNEFAWEEPTGRAIGLGGATPWFPCRVKLSEPCLPGQGRGAIHVPTITGPNLCAALTQTMECGMLIKLSRSQKLTLIGIIQSP